MEEDKTSTALIRAVEDRIRFLLGKCAFDESAFDECLVLRDLLVAYGVLPPVKTKEEFDLALETARSIIAREEKAGKKRADERFSLGDRKFLKMIKIRL